MKTWKLCGGSILRFHSPLERADGATSYTTLGEGVVCLEDEAGDRNFLTMLYEGNDLFSADGTAIEGTGAFRLADLAGNEVHGSMELDPAGANDDTVNSVIMTLEGGSGKFNGISGVIPLASRVTPGHPEDRYFSFLEGEGRCSRPGE